MALNLPIIEVVEQAPVYIVDSIRRQLLGGRVYEVTHIGNQRMGWMLSAESVRIRIGQKQAIFKMIDPITGYEEQIGIFRAPDGNVYPRSHNGVRFTDAILALGDCHNCKLID